MLPSAQSPPRPIARFRLGAVLGINQTLSWGMTFYLPAIVTGAAAETLHQATFRILGAFSWALLVTGLCAPRVGRWIDQHGGRGALLASILVIALGQVLLACAASLTQWYLGWTVIGAGMAIGLYDAAFATIGGLLGQAAGPTITGVTLVAGFASTVFWTLGAALIGAFGWRGLLLSYAGLMLAINLPMVWLLVPPAPPRRRTAPRVTAADGTRPDRRAVSYLAAFFTMRWFITSAIAVHILPLLAGIGLTSAQAVGIAAVIGPGQVFGRILEWTIGTRVGLLTKARLGAMLFPLGAAMLLTGGILGCLFAAAAFALLYGMSNGILTVNRGTLPLALFGADGYARLLGWLAVPVLLAQATGPTLAAPLVAGLPALEVLLISGAGAAAAMLFLLPLHLPPTSTRTERAVIGD
ncbi:MFS transporter [Rhodopila sp.]|uniref:MFS transporter n=1 Tax=Rhodopila sp. TaxID=2480087 RepID=UPI003D14BAFA